MRCKLMLGCAGFSCRSNAVVFTDFCSSPVSLARLSVKVSAIRKSMKGIVATVLAKALRLFPRALLIFGPHFET